MHARDAHRQGGDRAIARLLRDGLARFAGCSAVASVIRCKRNAVIEPATLRAFQDILREFVRQATPLPPLASAEEWFRAARNSAGVIAIRAFRNEDTSSLPEARHCHWLMISSTLTSG